jgi:hypothetical protein
MMDQKLSAYLSTRLALLEAWKNLYQTETDDVQAIELTENIEEILDQIKVLDLKTNQVPWAVKGTLLSEHHPLGAANLQCIRQIQILHSAYQLRLNTRGAMLSGELHDLKKTRRISRSMRNTTLNVHTGLDLEI